MFVSLVVFLLVLGILVFVHELGHFAVAKWTGMRVDEFGIGFPPRLFTKKKGETLYAINAIPLGGYVKIHGESGVDGDKDPRAFPNRPIWARMLVIVAGVSMNILFAFLVLSVAYTVGFPSLGPEIDSMPGAVIEKSDVYIGEVLKDSPAEKAGIEAGGVIRSFKDTRTNEVTTVDSISSLQSFTKTHQAEANLEIITTVDRDGKLTDYNLTLAATGPPLGVAVENFNQVRLPFWQAPVAAAKVIGYIVDTTWEALKHFAIELVGDRHLDEQVSGPVGIYKATSAATEQGVVAVTFLTVALSVNLALLNIMPIPALDGGKLVFLVIEAAFRKKVVSEQIENVITTIGFALLIGLITIVTLRDLGLF